VAIYDAAGAAEEEDGQPGAAAAATVPPLKLQQVPAEDQEVTLSPELRRALTGAKDGLEAADKELQAAKAAAAAAGASSLACFVVGVAALGNNIRMLAGTKLPHSSIRLAVLYLVPVQLPL
jgi:hypothetical protein